MAPLAPPKPKTGGCHFRCFFPNPLTRWDLKMAPSSAKNGTRCQEVTPLKHDVMFLKRCRHCPTPALHSTVPAQAQAEPVRTIAAHSETSFQDTASSHRAGTPDVARNRFVRAWLTVGHSKTTSSVNDGGSLAGAAQARRDRARQNKSVGLSPLPMIPMTESVMGGGGAYSAGSKCPV